MMLAVAPALRSKAGAMGFDVGETRGPVMQQRNIPRLLRNLGLVLISRPSPHQPGARYTRNPTATGYAIRVFRRLVQGVDRAIVGDIMVARSDQAMTVAQGLVGRV